MTDTSFLQFSSPFIDPKTGMLQRWAHQYLLNPTVSNINVAAGGTFNAAGATVVAKSVQLGIPLRPSSGGTGQSAPGAAAANAIGALAEANNLSDVANAGTSRTNLGLGTLATLSTVTLTTNVTGVLPVANGGTNASAPGATAANNIGALAIASNLSDLANAGTARTSLGLGTIATENANAVAITGGSIDGTTVGVTTPAAVKATTLAATGAVTFTSGTVDGISIGATTASTGAFTTLAASSTVSGTGFSTYLASPPAIGGSAAAAGAFTTLTATSIALGGGTVLANYVEGTFTPTLVSSGGGAPTYGVQAGFYTRIGNRVLFNFKLTITALNTLAAGTLSIGGLPVTSNATANDAPVLAVQANNLGATAVTTITCSVVINSTTLALGKYAAGSTSVLTQGDITGTAIFNVAGHYQV